MLKLSKITREYKVADQTIQALKGISVCFRKSEFVSILGPSGCGKTTTLNIIGGLDKYTDGDLVINGKSTKEFGDRDWDVYRNHRIGFIFQAYNLIPHQTILGNVELALTIAGVDKATRVEKAKKALDRVGLQGQYYKKPNQLSGGQCQRVAIARALVNEPDILLADEPTGALDTVTSVQIMDLIKEISGEKLVIMVTHNPELAEQYSTRIVKLKDGEILEDSNPFTEEEEAKEVAELAALEEAELKAELESANGNTEALNQEEFEKIRAKKQKEKAKMSFFTAFKLSARNLHSKLKRTIMVALAGCIGIVGVSTVLAVSTGVHEYIDNMQNDMISGNPIRITQSGMDISALMNSSDTMKKAKAVTLKDKINVDSTIEYLIDHQKDISNMLIEQDITEDYVKYVKDMPKEYVNAISFNYGFDITSNIYTDYTVTRDKAADAIIATNADSSVAYKNENYFSVKTIREIYTSLIRNTEEYGQYASTITGLSKPFSQEIDNYDYIMTQYDLVEGALPKSKNDIMLVVNEKGQISDLALAQLGFYTQEEFFNLIYKNTKTEDEFATGTNGVYKKTFEYSEIMSKKLYWYPNDAIFNDTGSTFTYNTSMPSDNTGRLELNICGIIKQKKGVDYGSLKPAFFYTTALTDHILANSKESKIVKKIDASADQKIDAVLGSYVFVDKAFGEANYTLYEKDESNTPFTVMFGSAGVDSAVLVGLMTGNVGLGELAALAKPKLEKRELGGAPTPQSISIYSVDFKVKDKVTNYLDKWNDASYDIELSDGTILYGANSKLLTVNDNGTPDNAEDDIYTITGTGVVVTPRSQLKYQDAVGLIMAMITSMVDMVTIALVAFTALSLVVSTVMIGIITYVSVVERIKEIGVIRSLGGRKKDVSHLFNAETFIIGLASGVLGIVITLIICLITNAITNHAAGFSIAHLTIGTSITMITISILLTLISGLMPAKAAAKKDPVVALRTE